MPISPQMQGEFLSGMEPPRGRFASEGAFAESYLPELAGCGRKGTAIWRVHVAPLASRPVNIILTDDGTGMLAAFKFAESAPCAGSVALPKKPAMEPA